MTATAHRIPGWHFELAGLTNVEMYYGGWGADQETAQLELGERVMDWETRWLPAGFYTELRDRVWAAVGYMYVSVIEALRAAGRCDEEGAVSPGDVPAGWRPDTEAWDEGRLP